MSGAEFLSFLQLVAECGGGREDRGEFAAPIVLLVHVCAEVTEDFEAFLGEASLRGRGCRGFGGEVRVGESLEGLKNIDRGWDVGRGEFYKRILEEIAKSVEVRA